MNWILGIDTTSTELSLGLLHDGKPVISLARYIHHSHAEYITTAVQYLLHSSGITAKDISHAGIAVGPGSFTGLRIGIAFLKGFLLMRPTLVTPVSSLESLARSYHVLHGDVVAAMDGRNNAVFCARFTCEGQQIHRVTADEKMSAEQFKSFVKDSDIVICDTLGYHKSTVFDFLQNRKNVAFSNTVPLQRGFACASIAAERRLQQQEWYTSVEITPQYMQESYAVVNKAVNS